jgi:hypothetical protein
MFSRHFRFGKKPFFAYITSGSDRGIFLGLSTTSLFMKKEHEGALRWYREALSLYNETGSEETRGLTAENIACLAAAFGNSTE